MTNLYSDDEMIEEIKEEIEELGGAVTFVPHNTQGRGGGLQLYIEPELLEQARLIVADIRRKYRIRRQTERTENPFIGVEELLDRMK